MRSRGPTRANHGQGDRQDRRARTSPGRRSAAPGELRSGAPCSRRLRSEPLPRVVFLIVSASYREWVDRPRARRCKGQFTIFPHPMGQSDGRPEFRCHPDRRHDVLTTHDVSPRDDVQLHYWYRPCAGNVRERRRQCTRRRSTRDPEVSTRPTSSQLHPRRYLCQRIGSSATRLIRRSGRSEAAG